MKKIILIKPEQVTIDSILEFKNDFLNNNEAEIPGSSGLRVLDDISEWISKLRKNPINDITSHVYFAVSESDNKLLGIINFRYPYEDFVKVYGHIGYAVRPSERSKGIATAMLHELLVFSKDLYSGPLLITCDKKNIGSRKTIVNNGGILESEVESKDRITQRYWIQQ